MGGDNSAADCTFFFVSALLEYQLTEAVAVVPACASSIRATLGKSLAEGPSIYIGKHATLPSHYVVAMLHVAQYNLTLSCSMFCNMFPLQDISIIQGGFRPNPRFCQECRPENLLSASPDSKTYVGKKTRHSRVSALKPSDSVGVGCLESF